MYIQNNVVLQNNSYKSFSNPNFGKRKVESSYVKNNNDNKKTIAGLSIAGVLLLGFIFRKNIKNLFKGNKPTEPPKPPIEPPIEPPKPPVEPEKPKVDLESTLSEYHDIVEKIKPFPSTGSESEKVAWRKTDEHRRNLLKQLKVNNISIVLKQEFPISPLETSQDKLKYLTSLIVDSAFNKASKDDVISEYTKYAGRYWFDKKTDKSFIKHFSIVCRPLEEETDDTYNYSIAERFIDVAEKISERDNSGMRDATKVLWVLDDYGKLMDEKLALRYIELLKKISFQQIDEHTVYYALQHLQDRPAIKKAMDEFREILKVFPEEDKTKYD